MQTFLPYADPTLSSTVLDYRRLGKQRVEGYQIWRTLTGNGKGWENHPAVKMWKGYQDYLAFYTNCMILEWKSRGYKNTMELLPTTNIIPPPWLDNKAFHASHRSNLLRKDVAWYSKFGWTEPDNLPYVWPV